MTGATSFGSGAEPFAAELGMLPVLVVAADGIPAGYAQAAAARRAGQEFAILFLAADIRGSHAYDVASQIVRQGEYDRQRMRMDAIFFGTLDIGGGRKLSELNEPDQMLRAAVADLCRLADAVVVRSWQEAERLRDWSLYSHPNVVRWYPARDLGTWTPHAQRDLVVVWAPDYQSEKTDMHTFALHDLHADVVVICNGIGISSRVRYVEAESPEVPALLSRALCVVDVTLDDPSWAQAFAARGVSVAAAATSGAGEVADGLALYYPWSHKSIWAATLEALSRGQSVAREAPPSAAAIQRSIESSRPVPPAREPLVSIVIPTYNRRNDLLRVLRKLKEQTYLNFEVVVVNDGGTSVADIAELDTRFRPIDCSENAGPFRATNLGLGAARGEYVQIGADDDEWYPDHLIRLVEALERTGAAVAHSNALIRFESDNETTGYNGSVFCRSLDHTSVLSSSPVAGNAYMVRREAFDRAGNLDETFLLADQEIQIRLAEISDFVHVPHVTAEWLVRGGQQLSQKRQKDVPTDMRRIFERHPASGRSYVAALRENAIKNVLARAEGVPFGPVISLVPPKL